MNLKTIRSEFLFPKLLLAGENLILRAYVLTCATAARNDWRTFRDAETLILHCEEVII